MSDSSLFNLSVGGLKPAVLSFELLEGIFGDDELKVGFLASSGCSESLPREKCKSPVAKNNSHQNIRGKLTLQGKTVEIN
jgi:hypothetical protein